MRYPPVTHRTVLVTGCSSGIGLAAVRLLREKGWRAIPTARKEDDLEMLRGEGFEPVSLDVSDPASVEKAVKDLLALTGGELGGLVNNAGFGQAGAVEDLSREALRYQFEVNVIGMQDLTNRLLPTFRAHGAGRIVNISSVLGRVTTPMTGGYCATKYAMEALSDALRVELRGTGIAVSLVEPGPIVSNFRKNAAENAARTLDTDASRFGNTYASEIERRRKQNKAADFFTRPPEDVAVKILHALESPRPGIRYCVTLPAYAGAFLRRFAPSGLLDRLLASKVVS